MRPVFVVSRGVAAATEVTLTNQRKVWANPYFAEKLVEHGFAQDEEFILCYQVFSDSHVFVGKERHEVSKETSSDSATPPKRA